MRDAYTYHRGFSSGAVGCYLDEMRRNTEMVSYGYPVVEGVDGYPLDLW